MLNLHRTQIEQDGAGFFQFINFEEVEIGRGAEKILNAGYKARF